MIEQMKPELFSPSTCDIMFYRRLGLSWYEVLEAESHIIANRENPSEGCKELADKLLSALDKYAIGYCDATNSDYEHIGGWLCLMCERDGRRFWFHVAGKTLNALRDYQKRKSDQATLSAERSANHLDEVARGLGMKGYY